MIKKIIAATLLVGLTSLLIWGGVNRSQAKGNEGNTSTNGRQGQYHNTSNNINAGESSGIESHGSRGYGRGNLTVNNSYGQEVGYSALSDNQIYNSANIGNGKGYRGGNGNNASPGQGNSLNQLDDSEIQALKLALDDEYHALAVYQSVINTFGAVDPFVEIAQSEQRHINALLTHFEKHSIPVPENNWLGTIPEFDSIQSACQTGVQAEIANVELYEQLLKMTDDPGLTRVFTNLSQASQQSHLPQFQSCQ